MSAQILSKLFGFFCLFVSLVFFLFPRKKKKNKGHKTLYFIAVLLEILYYLMQYAFT